ncbi:unnamed protein product [Boreogadus saida]
MLRVSVVVVRLLKVVEANEADGNKVTEPEGRSADDCRYRSYKELKQQLLIASEPTSACLKEVHYEIHVSHPPTVAAINQSCVESRARMLRLQQAGPEPRALCLRATHPPSTCSFLLFLDIGRCSDLLAQAALATDPAAPIAPDSWPSLALPRLQAVEQSFRFNTPTLEAQSLFIIFPRLSSVPGVNPRPERRWLSGRLKGSGSPWGRSQDVDCDPQVFSRGSDLGLPVTSLQFLTKNYED